MKNHYRLSRSLFVFALSAGMVFTACTKDDDPEPAAPEGGGNATTAPSTTPNFIGADATLWGVKTFTSTPIGSIEVGVGVAVFTNDAYATFVNVGSVGLNGTDLTAQSNNSYTSTSSQTNPLGIDFSNSNTNWSVAGGNGFPGFTRDVSATEFAFPAIDAISSGDVVIRADGYTLTVPAVASADSMLFVVGSVAKTLVGTATSCTFTAAELAGLATGSSLVQVAAYSYISEDQGGKNIYFGKETVRTKAVTIQ